MPLAIKPVRAAGGVNWLLLPLFWLGAPLFPTWLGRRIGAASLPMALAAFVLTCALAALGAGEIVLQREARTQPGWRAPGANPAHPYAIDEALAKLRRSDPRAQAHPLTFEVRTWVTHRLNTLHPGRVPGWTLILPLALAGLMAVVSLVHLAAGEKRRWLLLRVFKLSLWSALAVPFTLLLYWHALEWSVPPALLDREISIAPGVALALTLWLSVLTRLGRRSGRTPTAMLERPLECTACGYSLVGLAEEGNCPECGRAVRDSLPQSRQPTAWERARGLARLPAWFSTCWGILTRRRYFQDLSLPPNACEASLFAAGAAWLFGIYFGVRVVMHGFNRSSGFGIYADALTLMLAACLVSLLIRIFAGLVGLLAFRDTPLNFQRRCTALLYSAPFWFPFQFVLVEFSLFILERIPPTDGAGYALLLTLSLAIFVSTLLIGGLAARRAMSDMQQALPAGFEWDAARGEWRHAAQIEPA